MIRRRRRWCQKLIDTSANRSVLRRDPRNHGSLAWLTPRAHDSVNTKFIVAGSILLLIQALSRIINGTVQNSPSMGIAAESLRAQSLNSQSMGKSAKSLCGSHLRTATDSNANEPGCDILTLIPETYQN